jgi:hypothetical protein
LIDEAHMRTTVAAVISGAAAAALPWVAAVGQVVLNRGYEAGDLAPFGFWSALYGLGMVGVSWLLVEITLDLSPPTRYLIGTLIGLATALACTVLISVVLGPWMGGFGFPVLSFWALGGVVALWLAVRLTTEVPV